MMRKAIIFSDLDGTLLDHHDYSFSAANHAMDEIRELGIPLIIVTSKTRGEVTDIIHALQLSYPYIVENGSAIIEPEIKSQDSEKEIILGKKLEELIPVYKKLKQQFPIKGFVDMEVKEIMERTGLSRKSAEQARRRDYSIPFVIESDQTETVVEEIKQECSSFGCKILQGGRFYHLLGDTSKGKAIQKLISKWIDEKVLSKNHISFGIGDAPNDIDIFRAVDIPIQVEKPGGGYRELKVPVSRLIYAKGEGPAGWQWAFDHIIKPRILMEEA